MDLEVDGNVALVAASSSGLGKASAKALASEGADVVINGRDERRLKEAVDEVLDVASGTVVGQQGDITNPDDVEDLVARAVAEFDGLDHLVTSAGGPTPMRPLEPSDEEWYRSFDLLTMSVVRLVREAEEYLRADGGGSIVNITSGVVKEAKASNVLSSSVRMAVLGLEKTLSKELAPDVRVNAVLPGAHESPRIEQVFNAAVDRGEYDSYEKAVAARTESIPVGRLGDPEAFGEVVSFLCSERASYINGVAVPVDGGASASTL